MDTIQDIKLEVGVKALIMNDAGQYLALKRSKPYPGEEEPRWDIPGGRINLGETLLDALAREIKEETNLKMTGTPEIILGQDILRVPGKHTVRLTYLAKASGNVELSDEHPEYQWVNLESFKQLYHDLYLDPVFVYLEKH